MSEAPESALRAKPARARTRAPNVTSSSASRRQIGHDGRLRGISFWQNREFIDGEIHD
jgi:hypothetical protein